MRPFLKKGGRFLLQKLLSTKSAVMPAKAGIPFGLGNSLVWFLSRTSEVLDLSRRHFMQVGLTGAACLAAKPSLAFGLRGASSGMKELAFYNLHTDEKLRVTFWKDGNFDRAAMAKINHILRDHRSGEVYPMAANLIELLHDLQMRLRTDAPIEIISGYRSPKTNAMLANASDGVARQSLHTKGLATDIRMKGATLRQVQMAALFMQRGGVGFYPKSNFVHVDVGRVRRWG